METAYVVQHPTTRNEANSVYSTGIHVATSIRTDVTRPSRFTYKDLLTRQVCKRVSRELVGLCICLGEKDCIFVWFIDASTRENYDFGTTANNLFLV